MRKKLTRLIAGLLILVGVILLVRFSGTESLLERERLQAWIAGYGTLGPILFILGNP